MAHRRPRRRFTREYKAQAVQRLIESGRPLADIAAELDVSPGQLGQWRNEQLAAGSAEALAARKAEQAETQRLRREVKRLEEEVEILRKAAAFFARGIACASSPLWQPSGPTTPSPRYAAWLA
jgi:transposase